MDFAFTLLSNTFIQFGLLIGAPAVSGLGLSWLANRTNSIYGQFIFPRVGLWFFGPVGIPVHELSHYLFCRLFGLKVQKVKWFDPKGRGGSHGSVVHSYDPWNIRHRIGHIFVGLAPVLVGPALIAGGVYAAGWQPSFASLSGIVELPWPALLLFLYLSFAISSQLELSTEDLKVASSGLVPAFIFLLAINALAALVHANIHGWTVENGLVGLLFWTQILGLTAALSVLHLLGAWLVTSAVHVALRRSPTHPLR